MFSISLMVLLVNKLVCPGVQIELVLCTCGGHLEICSIEYGALSLRGEVGIQDDITNTVNFKLDPETSSG